MTSRRRQTIERIALPLGVALGLHLLALVVFLHMFYRNKDAGTGLSMIMEVTSAPEEAAKIVPKRVSAEARPLPPTAPPAALKVISQVTTADIEVPLPDWANLDAGMLAFSDGMAEIAQAGGGFGELPLQTLRRSVTTGQPKLTRKLRCSPEDRLALIEANGGVPACEDAVVRALDWLKEQQNEDGSWGENYRTHLTALALLGYLGHCETTESADYGETVSKAIVYLIELALEDDGHMMNRSNLTPYQHSVYACLSHALGTQALAETHLMLKDSKAPFPFRRELEKVLKQAVEATLSNQNRQGTFFWDEWVTYQGGLRPKSQSRLTRNYRKKAWLSAFLFHTSWHLQALAIAQQTGIEFGPKFREGTVRALQAVEELHGWRPSFNRHVRLRAGGLPFSHPLEAVDGHEPLVFQSFGQGRHECVDAGIRGILERRPILGARLFDLKLMPAREVSELPSEGRRLVVLAGNAEQIFVRIFDRRGQLVIDQSRRDLSAERFEILKEALMQRKHFSIDQRGYLINHLFAAYKVHELEPYGWYTNTYACFNRQGRAWEKWHAMMLPQLLETQHENGSWPVDFEHLVRPESVADAKESRLSTWPCPREAEITVTALYALTLEVYYRYQIY